MAVGRPAFEPVDMWSVGGRGSQEEKPKDRLPDTQQEQDKCEKPAAVENKLVLQEVHGPEAAACLHFLSIPQTSS